MASGGREKPGEDPLSIFVLRSHTLAALRHVGIMTSVRPAPSPNRRSAPSDQRGPQERGGPEGGTGGAEPGSEDLLSCLALPRPLSGRDEAMVHMRGSGAGPTAIARHFGISRSRVNQVLDRAEQRSD